MRTIVKNGRRRAVREDGAVIVINRFRVEPTDQEPFRAGLEQALAVLGRQRGFVEGHLGRNVDDPTLWVLSTRWANVGSYRRALSAYDVKVEAWDVLGRALDEPSAYEVIAAGEEPNRPEPRVR